MSAYETDYRGDADVLKALDGVGEAASDSKLHVNLETFNAQLYAGPLGGMRTNEVVAGVDRDDGCAVTRAVLTTSNIRLELSRNGSRLTVTLAKTGPHDAVVVPILLRAAKAAEEVLPRRPRFDQLRSDFGDGFAKLAEELVRTQVDSERLVHRLAESLLEQRTLMAEERKAALQEVKDAAEARRAEFEEEVQRVRGQLAAREEELEAARKLIDDSDSRSARRRAREELRTQIDDRLTTDAPSGASVALRRAVHGVFLLIITLLVVAAGHAALTHPNGADLPYWLRLFGLTTAAIGFSWYYLRWNIAWSDRHADDEARLARLKVDLDRAAYAVEFALEWPHGTRSDLQELLVARLTAGLFESSDAELVTARSETLATLLARASTLKLNIPPLGEAEIRGKDLGKGP